MTQVIVKGKGVPFSTLFIGECFTFGGKLYQKSNTLGMSYNVWNISEGKKAEFTKDAEVFRVSKVTAE